MASEMPSLHPDESSPPSGARAEAVAIGFEDAFDALVERHYPRLCTFALQILGSPDAAEDAVQEVLYKIWSRRTIENVRDPVPYLFRAVHNQCLMALRRERRWQAIDIDENDPVHAVVPEVVVSLDLQDAIAKAIATLPERTRLVFTMHRQQDLTYRDIARILGISVKTVETQMTRALKILRRQLETFFCLAAAVLLALEWSYLSR